MNQDKALLRAPASSGVSIDFSGHWVNELGSVANLAQVGHVLMGSYRSAVSTDGTSATGEVQGFVNGDLIAFVVYWSAYQAITAWVGQLEPGRPVETLKTLWQMTTQVDIHEEWASVHAGSDTFTRLPA